MYIYSYVARCWRSRNAPQHIYTKLCVSVCLFVHQDLTRCSFEANTRRRIRKGEEVGLSWQILGFWKNFGCVGGAWDWFLANWRLTRMCCSMLQCIAACFCSSLFLLTDGSRECLEYFLEARKEVVVNSAALTAVFVFFGLCFSKC